MADILVSAVLQVAINKAATFLQQQLFGAPSELKHKIQKLQRTLAIIKGMIGDAEKRVHSSVNTGLHTWLVHLRDVVYDAEDVFDMLEYRRLEEKVMKATTTGSLRYAIMSWNPMNSIENIKEIQENLDHLLSMANYFKLEMVAEVLRHVNDDDSQGRRTSPDISKDIENFLGRDADKKKIIDLLLDNHSSDSSCTIPVISIFGMGGQGKTTLAQFIFHSEEVDNHFELKMWVCVSLDFRVDRIIQDILKSFVEHKTKRKPMENTLKIEKNSNVFHDVKGKSLKRLPSKSNQATLQEENIEETCSIDLKHAREKLDCLIIGDCPELCALPDNGVPRSLKRLVIDECPKIKKHVRATLTSWIMLKRSKQTGFVVPGNAASCA